ncbi:SNF2 family N-terminal domain-containing protein, partial [Aspergillus crustosus]
MARESTAPTDPITPGKPGEQTNRSLQNQPEFGKPSPLRPTHPQNRSINNPFNIPKQNRPRPEHHRSQQQQQQQQPEIQRPIPNPFKHNATQQNMPPVVASTQSKTQSQVQPHQIRHPIPNPFHQTGSRFNMPPQVTSTLKRSEPFDPFKPVRPSAYNNNRMSRPVDNDVIEIRRPENITFNTPRAPKSFYASKPSPMKQTNASKNLQNFVDLTTPAGGGFSTSRTPAFGSVGASDWVDTAKANENIKALLEGAFEDEDEKQPKPKGKKKNKKSKSKNKDSQKQDKTKEESLDMDDLAAQLQGVSVNEAREASDDGHTDEGKATMKKDIKEIEDQDSTDEKGSNDAEAESEDESEESEDEDDDGIVEGLNVILLPHQRQGLKWMCEKEIGSRKGKREIKGVLPKGGILADDMGLGKTVQAIALLLTNNKPKDGTRRRPDTFDYDEESDESEEENVESRKLPPGLSKSTLVVAPLALIKQWESEIKTKVEPAGRLKVLVYHGNARAKSTGSLDKYDVVITTYGTLTSEHNASTKNDKAGVFSVYWYRIILDEAHTIKNRNAKATQAAYALDAEYRWCLSGTPMQNNLDELQSLIRFLRIKPYNDLANWKDQITRPLANGRGGLAIERLQVVLKAFMKRRTKDVLKMNANRKANAGKGDGGKKDPGFHIVKREVIKVAAEFMPGERNFYERLEQRTENSLEKMMGDSKMDYAGALVLLLRLRQSCNHPDLVKSDLVKDKDILLQTGTSKSQPLSGKQPDLDDVADLFGALSVVTKKCDICQMELSQAESAGGGSRCGDCEKDFNTPFAADGAKKKKVSKDIIDLTASPSARRSEHRMERFRKNRRVILDSDEEEEDDGDWIVPESQRAHLSLGKAGGSDDEDAEGGGEWI